MERKRKLWVAKAAVIAAVAPVLLWAYEYGPNPGYVGIPGENGGKTCGAGAPDCHTGMPNDPKNSGNIAVAFANGTAYVPGVKQRITVTVTDPAPTQKGWGFELTARLASNLSTMAGTFAPVDNNTEIMCSQTNLQVFNAYCLEGATASGSICIPSSAPACPANLPLAYMEHSNSGYIATLGPDSGTYEFDWMPPATNVGNIAIYVAGNAGTGNPSPGKTDKDLSHIYATKYMLTASNGGPLPVIGGVSNNAGGQPGVFPNAYVSIYGQNLAPSTAFWAVNGKLPTLLNGVTVAINGQAAYVSFVSSGQINALVPNVGLGSMQVTVSTPSGTSVPFTVVSQQYAPAFFPWPGGQPVATHADFTWAVKNGTFAGTTTIPAKPGEAIILWGTGFGPTNPAAPVGVPVPSSPTYFVATPATATINGVPASVYATVLAPGFAGEYQLIVTVPPSLANGDYPVVATINGAQSPRLTLTVHN